MSAASSAKAPPASLVVRRGNRSSVAGAAGLVAVVGFAAVWVPFHQSLGTLTDLVGLFVLVILGTTWNLMAGYGGLVSIGQQAFIGLGGYLTVYVADRHGIGVLASLLVAGAVCGLLALPVSFLVFRLVGGYFAIGTWVVAEVIKLITTQVDAFGGGSGLSLTAYQGVERSARIGQIYWTALALAVLTVLATYAVMRSRLGLGLAAIRDDPVAAAGLGVAVARSRRIVYVASSVGAGLAGALVAVNALRVTPDSMFSVNYTAAMIFVVVIGGIGTIEGPIVGAVVYYLLQHSLQDYGVWYLVVVGAVAVGAVLLLPSGLWGLISRHGRFAVFPVARSVVASPVAASSPSRHPTTPLTGAQP